MSRMMELPPMVAIVVIVCWIRAAAAVETNKTDGESLKDVSPARQMEEVVELGTESESDRATALFIHTENSNVNILIFIKCFANFRADIM
jgi:hypothetical protein